MALRSYTFSSKLRSKSLMSSSSTPPLWDGKPLRKYPTQFKSPAQNFFARLLYPSGAQRRSAGGKKIRSSLATELRCSNFLSAATRGPSASRGLGEKDAGGVRRRLVPILLNGGFGYENL